MGSSNTPGPFPWATIFAGIVGFSLRCWLLSDTDAKGLLPHNHIAGILCLVLLAVVLIICGLFARKASAASYEGLFPASAPAAAGIFLGAAGIALSAFTVSGAGLLRLITPVGGVLAGAALGYAGYCRLKGMRPNGFLYGGVAVYLILRTMSCCQQWNAETQMQLFIFQLFACLFLLLTCYFRAELVLDTKHTGQYLFFSQAALFCCCLCCRGDDWLFYLAGAVWIAAETCTLSLDRRWEE